jgi:hypothetical protein
MDVTVGGEAWLRGQWADRLAALDADLADMQNELNRATNGSTEPMAAPLLTELEPAPLVVQCRHEPPASFESGQPLAIEFSSRGTDGEPIDAMLHYRHVNQAERYVNLRMQAGAGADVS